jgi:hypothetical protein
MLAVLISGMLLVVGALGLGIYAVFFRSDSAEPGEPRPATSSPAEPGAGGSGSTAVTAPASTDELAATARDYVAAVNDQDKGRATALTCERKDPGTLFSVTEGRTVTLVRVEVVEGAVGTARVRVGGSETEILMESQEDGWCVAI